MLVNILGIIDDAKCYEVVRHLRWPDGVRCPHCDSDEVVKQGRDETEPHRQRYECRSCGRRFDDLTDTIFAGHGCHRLRRWLSAKHRVKGEMKRYPDRYIHEVVGLVRLNSKGRSFPWANA